MIRRRELLLGGGALGAFLATAPQVWAKTVIGNAALPASAKPFPLSAVRLTPSVFLDAVEGNRRFLLWLEPDRLLHNYRNNAGLGPKGKLYGGWEQDTIAGHTLGHYLSALALMYAQTGDIEMKRRADYIVDQLAECQAAEGDGYVAGFTRKRGEIVENGKLIFPELMRGEIRSQGFDLNGSWVPLYNWHKLYAGLFDVQTWCGNAKGIAIATALGGYIDKVFAALDDDQVQKVLDCEHGGINESFAELYARTKDARWLKLAERLRHKKVLDPLTRGEDILPNHHANTQIPKLIGLARLHELTGDVGQGAAPRFFWDTVTRDYSYVIGGNADREYFPAPRTISRHITESTCESCNSYNMLKLTRHLYAWRPQAHLFDYYERTHLNHILAQQDPATGKFAYMVPMASGAARGWSDPEYSFWCCVGSGMESHAKHGESIWWEGGDTLLVNLFIPSTLDWKARHAKVSLETGYPFDGKIGVVISALAKPQTFAIALRIPSWSQGATVMVNDKPNPLIRADGYAIIRRNWRAGDRVTLDLPLTLRSEATNDDPDVIALLRGPLVLAADVGPADKEFAGPAPALIGANVLDGFVPAEGGPAHYRTTGVLRPEQLTFAPFFQQRQRRTAVYFRRFTETGWQANRAVYVAAEARRREVEARTVDLIHLGEMQQERDHKVESKESYPIAYRGRNGRDARKGGYIEFEMKARSGPLVLQASYWGDERPARFDILVDGTKVATQTLGGGASTLEFIDVDYPLPSELTEGKATLKVRFQPAAGESRCGPIYDVRVYVAQAAAKA
ncbi:DUF1680 family protein [Sphingomonas sp. UYAg733]